MSKKADALCTKAHFAWGEKIQQERRTLRACRDTGNEPDRDCLLSSSGSFCTTCSSVSCWQCDSLIGSRLARPPGSKQCTHQVRKAKYGCAGELRTSRTKACNEICLVARQIGPSQPSVHHAQAYFLQALRRAVSSSTQFAF